MAVTAVTGKWPGVACKPALQSTSSFTETPARLACKSRNSGSAGKVQARAAAVSTKEEQWEALDSDMDYLTRSARLVQWYPGHIAKAERSLKEQLKLMDVVIEVRDARIPMATAHPEIDEWMGHKKKILVLNREDMVSAADKQAWGEYFAKQGISVLFSNGQRGTGTMKLARLAKSAADGEFSLAHSGASHCSQPCALFKITCKTSWIAVVVRVWLATLQGSSGARRK